MNAEKPALRIAAATCVKHARRMTHRRPPPHLRGCLAAVLALLAACAAVPAGARAATTGTVTVAYEGFAHGLIVLKLSATLTMTKAGYTGRLTMRTAGMVGWLVHMDNDSQVAGRFADGQAVPLTYDSTGSMRGVARTTHITYQNGVPHVAVLYPPVELDRTAVPADQTAATMDTLSAMAALMREAGERGTCDGTAKLFDGRRLTALTAHTVGPETLPASSKSPYAGPTLRCDFEGVRLAGFVKADSEAQQRLPRRGTAWLAPLVPGAPPVPVRVAFENKLLGQVMLYLTSVSGSPGAVAQNAGGVQMR